MASIDITGIDKVLAMADKLAAIQNLVPAVERSLALLIDKLTDYPAPPSGFKMVWKSDKQRRYFFAALRRGEITVPYQRTGTLGRLWTSDQQVTVNATGIEGRIGNATPYGPYVQAADQQAAIHVGRWPTVDDVAAQQGPAIQAEFDRTIDELVRSAAA